MIVSVESNNLPEKHQLMFVMEIHYAFSYVEAESLNIICLNFRPQMVNLTIPGTYSNFYCVISYRV
jgi:hypothetical protein